MPRSVSARRFSRREPRKLSAAPRQSPHVYLHKLRNQGEFRWIWSGSLPNCTKNWGSSIKPLLIWSACRLMGRGFRGGHEVFGAPVTAAASRTRNAEGGRPMWNPRTPTESRFGMPKDAGQSPYPAMSYLCVCGRKWQTVGTNSSKNGTHAWICSCGAELTMRIGVIYAPGPDGGQRSVPMDPLNTWVARGGG